MRMSRSLPEHIPDMPSLPNRRKYLSVQQVDHGWVMFLQPDPEVEVFASERYACSEWDANKSVIVNLLEGSWKNVPKYLNISKLHLKPLRRGILHELLAIENTGCVITMK